MSFRPIHSLKYMHPMGHAEVEARHVVLAVHGDLHVPTSFVDRLILHCRLNQANIVKLRNSRTTSRITRISDLCTWKGM